jgi:DNA-binding MarR family transcriptional regulator
MHRRTDAVLARTGVTADQFVVLAALSEGAARTQRDLVARTSSDPNSLRAMLVLLERRGLVERRPHPTDGRARSVSLTRKGRRVFSKAWRFSESLRQQLIGAVAPGDVASLTQLLQQLAANLGQSPPLATAKRRRFAAAVLT